MRMKTARFHELTNKLPKLKIVVLGDYLLDRYVYTDMSTKKTSIYSNQPVFDIIQATNSPGAAGTVAKNLASLGVENVYAVGFIGNDGYGFDLKSELNIRRINSSYLTVSPQRTTAACTMLVDCAGNEPIEKMELYLKDRTVTLTEDENNIISHIEFLLSDIRPDAVIIVDQGSTPDCSVLTPVVRKKLSELASLYGETLFFVDSRKNIHAYKNMIVKCNESEFIESQMYDSKYAIEDCCMEASRVIARPFIVTLGEKGVLFAHDGRTGTQKGLRITGKIDTRGTGDAFSTLFVTMLCCGARISEAVYFGNIAGAVCVSQLSTTGDITIDAIKIFGERYNYNEQT